MRHFERTRRLLLALPVLAGTMANTRAATAGVEALPFVPGSFREILAAAESRPLVVHLWGLTCAPCIVELPRWGAFVRRHPRANVAFIQTDPMPAGRVAAALRRAGLEDARNWSVQAPLDERSRYEIDPDWTGELPRTLLVAADGRRTGISGAMAFDRVRAWLAHQGMRS